jgi:hypothetical protein
LAACQGVVAVEHYLKEGIVSIVPVYTATERALVTTLEKEHQDGRTVPWLVEKLATYYSININDLRRLYGDILSIKKHVTLPINDDLILVPVKTRAQIAQGETTIGYFSLLQADGVEACQGEGDEPHLSVINFKNGSVLYTLNTVETLRDKIRQGDQVRRHLLKRRGSTVANKGLTVEDIILPHCECLLLDLFTELLHINKD